MNTSSIGGNNPPEQNPIPEKKTAKTSAKPYVRKAMQSQGQAETSIKGRATLTTDPTNRLTDLFKASQEYRLPQELLPEVDVDFKEPKPITRPILPDDFHVYIDPAATISTQGKSFDTLERGDRIYIMEQEREGSPARAVPYRVASNEFEEENEEDIVESSIINLQRDDEDTIYLAYFANSKNGVVINQVSGLITLEKPLHFQSDEGYDSDDGYSLTADEFQQLMELQEGDLIVIDDKKFLIGDTSALFEVKQGDEVQFSDSAITFSTKTQIDIVPLSDHLP